MPGTTISPETAESTYYSVLFKIIITQRFDVSFMVLFLKCKMRMFPFILGGKKYFLKTFEVGVPCCSDLCCVCVCVCVVCVC